MSSFSLPKIAMIGRHKKNWGQNSLSFSRPQHTTNQNWLSFRFPNSPFRHWFRCGLLLWDSIECLVLFYQKSWRLNDRKKMKSKKLIFSISKPISMRFSAPRSDRRFVSIRWLCSIFPNKLYLLLRWTKQHYMAFNAAKFSKQKTGMPFPTRRQAVTKLHTKTECSWSRLPWAITEVFVTILPDHHIVEDYCC